MPSLGCTPVPRPGPLLLAWFRIQWHHIESIRAVAAARPQELNLVADRMREIGQRYRDIDQRRQAMLDELADSPQTAADCARALIAARAIRADLATLRTELRVLRARAEAAASVAELREAILTDFHGHDERLRSMLEIADEAIAVLAYEGVTEDLAVPLAAPPERSDTAMPPEGETKAVASWELRRSAVCGAHRSNARWHEIGLIRICGEVTSDRRSHSDRDMLQDGSDSWTEIGDRDSGARQR